jgi:hypothetical protein
MCLCNVQALLNQAFANTACSEQRASERGDESGVEPDRLGTSSGQKPVFLCVLQRKVSLTFRGSHRVDHLPSGEQARHGYRARYPLRYTQVDVEGRFL